LPGDISIKNDDGLADETQGRRQKLTDNSPERKNRDFFFIHPRVVPEEISLQNSIPIGISFTSPIIVLGSKHFYEY